MSFWRLTSCTRVAVSRRAAVPSRRFQTVGGHISRRCISTGVVSQEVQVSDDIFLDPKRWVGLPPARIIDLYWERKVKLGLAYRPTKEELDALLTTSEYTGVSPKEIRKLYEQKTETVTSSVRYSKDDLKYGLRPFQFDELPSPAQDELANRHEENFYKKLAAFELPLLVQYRQEYKPPRDTDVVSYRYTSYFGEEHPNSRKVVLSVKTRNLGLDSKQLHKFQLLARTRYDFQTDTFKMSSDKFPESAQNARYLNDVFNRLLDESRDLSEDDFADVPLDTRHITAKNLRKRSTKGFEFPKEWNRPEDAPAQKVNMLGKVLDR
ncbi:mitochondrial 37S ribosomal protein mS35 KNAG_0A04830 [Huiozyma naganishii CBS 8797]|uniref:Small ribosomal subunit protein mS35 n=1 Tax=Huiozyma naganishii (strain ATCC MYA-139 / BCRC 22969 / CBS 8797 / KCTC 17520 / NBRC 10181 / NCYC 3082 / Yp74L-3) TaxID=1071383 RepID=J7RF17_HUIN7|nr:hypothetical protein KNAG_0A04830 [Kazachstania naganishii CBS 8797]CCK68153.1 hypothetical protein KNAG_0A04830 [Kazachstania naganishii CBS 8797]